MKKIIAVLLSFVIIFTLAACGSTKTNSSPDENTVMDTSEEPTVSNDTNEAESKSAPDAQDALIENIHKSSDGTSGSDFDPDFRAVMGAYEEFIDEYVAFYEKYKASDSDLSMLTEYMKMMEKYAQWAEKMDTIDEDELSESDYIYYSEVMLRCSEKLMSVAY